MGGDANADRVRKQMEDTMIDSSDDRTVWIIAYGSERLKLGLQAGEIENMVTCYHEERLAREMSEWNLLPADWRPCRAFNHTLHALVSLLRLQERVPSARIYWRADGSNSRPAAYAPLPWDITRHAWSEL